jgi:hypothetical protein
MREDTPGRLGGGESGDGALEVLKAWCEVRIGRTPGPSDVAEEWRRPCRAQLGHELSMGRLLEKLGPELYSPECVEGKFSEVELRMVGVLQSSQGYPLRRCADLRKLLCYICRIARGGGSLSPVFLRTAKEAVEGDAKDRSSVGSAGTWQWCKHY